MFQDVLQRLGIEPVNRGVFADRWIDSSGPEIESINPATGEPIARVKTAGRAEYDRCVEAAQRAFRRWRLVPAPQRGELVRRFSQALRERKQELGLLVTLET